MNKKANASNTYTKAEVNAAIDAKQIEVDDMLSITGAAADAKAVGDELTAVRADLDDIDNTLFGESGEERSEIFTDVGKDGPKLYIDYTNGSKTSFSVGWSYITAFIPIIGGSAIELSGVNTNNSQDKRGFALYNESKQYLNGVQYIKGKTNYSLIARNDARYIRITYDGISENPKIYMTVDGEGGIIRQLNDIEEKIESYEIDPSNPFSKIVDSVGLIEIFDTVGCIGDSLASGECVSSDHGNIDLYHFSWGQYLSRITGNTYYNFSAGGVTAKSWHTNAKCAPICFDGNHLCKMYIVGLGQNDANIIRNNGGAAAYIGTLEDINVSDYTANSDTFYGNYGKIIQRIKKVQEKAKIFILTDPADYVEEIGINTAIRNIANLFTNVYLLDLYTFKHGVYDNEIITNTRRSGHYNAIGYHEMALYIATYVDWYIRNNLSEFS